MSRDARGHARLRPMGWEPYQGPRSVRRLPGLLAGAVRILWQAAPRLVVLFAALQLVSAAMAGLTLFVVRAMVAALLAADRSHAGFDSVTAPR